MYVMYVSVYACRLIHVLIDLSDIYVASRVTCQEFVMLDYDIHYKMDECMLPKVYESFIHH